MVLIVGWLRNEAMALEGKAAIENTKRFLQVIFDGYIIIIIVFLPFFLIRRKPRCDEVKLKIQETSSTHNSESSKTPAALRDAMASIIRRCALLHAGGVALICLHSCTIKGVLHSRFRVAREIET